MGKAKPFLVDKLTLNVEGHGVIVLYNVTNLTENIDYQELFSGLECAEFVPKEHRVTIQAQHVALKGFKP